MNFSFKKHALILLLLLSVFRGVAQDEDNIVYRPDTLLLNDFQMVFLPLIFFTPETDFGFGLGAQTFFRLRGNNQEAKLSNAFLSAVYTTKNQFLLDFKPQLYFYNENYFLDGALKYKVFPNTFWGLGSDAPEEAAELYNMTSIEIRAAFLKSLSFLNFGFEYYYNNYSITQVDSGGILASGAIDGVPNAATTGISFVFNIDKRDNNFVPQKGSFIRVDAGFSSKAMGGSHSFNKYKIDYRNYISVGQKTLLAVQTYFEYTFGDVPFQNASWYGGAERARGYFRGRYIDNHLYVLQAEIRARVLPRWTLAGFITGGDVMNIPEDIFTDIKTSFGGGVRYKVKKDVQAVLRLDIGFNQFGDSGIYFGVNEAF